MDIGRPKTEDELEQEREKKIAKEYKVPMSRLAEFNTPGERMFYYIGEERMFYYYEIS